VQPGITTLFVLQCELARLLNELLLYICNLIISEEKKFTANSGAWCSSFIQIVYIVGWIVRMKSKKDPNVIYGFNLFLLPCLIEESNSDHISSLYIAQALNRLHFREAPKAARQACKHSLSYFGIAVITVDVCVLPTDCRPVRLDLSAQSAAIQQCFSLTTNQRTVLSAQ
jgi:hypothetical protein